jgi:rubrerythrin
MLKTIKDLTPQEVLALAIQAEEEDSRIYSDLARKVRQDYPETAKALSSMHDEEDEHRRRLFETYRKRFGDHIPLIRFQELLPRCN